MKTKLLSLVLLCLWFGCDKESTLVLENAKVVDVKTGKIKVYNVLIKGTKISEITKKKINASNKIDLTGRYIMPSFWDMHVHIHGNKDTLKKFFKNGILGIRDLGTFEQKNVDSLVKWKQEQQNNIHKEYPKIVYAGFTHNDSICYEKHRNITSIKELKASVQYLRTIGSSFYKIHNCFPLELLPALDSMATAYDFTFGGHIPHGLDPIEYIEQFENIGSVEHVSVLIRALNFRENQPLNMIEAINVLDGTYLDSLALLMKEKNVAFTPNLVSEYAFVKTYPEDKKTLGEALFEKLKNYTKRISDNGVLILAGTDAGLEVEAGRSFFNELKFLSDAGLSNLEVLQSATINADTYNKTFLNVISKNSEAKFLILENNPLEILPTPESLYGFVHSGKLNSN